MKRERKLKFTAALICALLLLTLLCACGNGGAAAKDVPVSDITAAVSAALDKSDSLVESDGMFLGLTKQGAEQIGDHAVLINVYGTNIDEYGVFKAGGMSAKDLKAVADDYLAKRLASWMEEYMPEEKPKLTNAEVRVSGDYVMYCILSDADKATAFQAFETAVKG